MSNSDSYLVQDNIGLTSSETVGVIVAVACGATVLIILVLMTSLACRYWFYRRSGRARLDSDAIISPRSKGGSARSPSSAGERVESYRLQERQPVTIETFQSLPSPPPVDDSTFTSQPNGTAKHAPPTTTAIEEVDAPQPVLQLYQFPRDDLMLQEKLGEGEYGPIYRGEAYGLGPNKESKPVTVKMLSPHEESTGRSLFELDIEMLSSINHLNVVGLMAVCTKDSPECALLDAGEPGDLLTYIRDKRNTVAPHIATEPENKELLRIADEISLGMAYLASERFIHKDLALRNCIIGLDGVVKIAHFGLGPLIYPEAYYRVNETDLPIRWMSPEAITSASFTSMSDVWSFGVTVWELFTYGELPFERQSDEDVLDYVLREGRLHKPIKSSNDIFELVLSCWASEPHSRPGFLDIHESLTELSGIQTPLNSFGSATPVSPSSPMTPTGDSGYIPSTFKSTTSSQPTS